MVGSAAAEPGEEILETVVVEQSVQIEACHYSNLLLRGLTK
jgi:hypothetical protein